MKIFKTTDGTEIKRVSRWINIKCRYVNPNHILHGYSDNGELLYFHYKRQDYALGQFLRFDLGPGAKTLKATCGAEEVVLSGYDATEMWYPLMIELDNRGEQIRLYQEVKK